MAGQAVFAFVPDSMFSVQLREAVAKQNGSVAFTSNIQDFQSRLQQVLPALVILDLVAVGGEISNIVSLCRQSGSKVVAFAPHAQGDLFVMAEHEGCDQVYSSAAFKMDIESILAKWLSGKLD
ncbi:MAG: hypothetical protein OWR52_12075 [Acidibacillus sp.]|nr:hypothetical protein [Acidibacillus sp.]